MERRIFMLTIAGGLVLGFLGVCGLILLASVVMPGPATPNLFAGIREGFRGFMEGMRRK